MTDPGKNALGLTGFPTPDSAADTPAYLLFLFQDPTWSQWLLGALENLVYEYNWYKSGNLETWEASEAFRLIIQQAPLNLLPLTAPTPYWDETSADDTDDELPRDTQPWYGEIVASPGFVAEDTPSLTFLDNLGIWLIAGFIAYAGKPEAAIAFVPIAKRFTLAFKQSNLGGVVRALIDFAPVAEIDTYGVTDGVASLSIVMPDDDDPHTLYVELTDQNPHDIETPSITVIRKKLSEDDIGNPAYRYNSDCDCIQFSPDGGTTWTDTPGADMRHADPFRLPPRGGTDIQCSAAANAECWLQTFIEQVTTLLEAGAVIVAVINKLLQFVELIFAETGGELLNLILAVAGSIFDIGGGALAAAFTSDQWPILLCAIYCNMDTSGQVSAARFATMQAQVTANMNTTAALVVNLLLSTQGEVGVSNAGAMGEETADCSDCGCAWCRTYLGGDGLGDWVVPYDILGHAGGSYNGGTDQIDGTSINDQNNVWASAYLSGALRVTEISVSFDYVNEGGEGSDTSSLNIFLDGVRHFTTYTGGTGSSSYTWTGDETVTTNIGFMMSAQVAMHVTCIEIRGFDTPPASGRDCS